MKSVKATQLLVGPWLRNFLAGQLIFAGQMSLEFCRVCHKLAKALMVLD